MAVEVRPISKNEYRPWLEAVWTAFGEDLQEGLGAVRARGALERGEDRRHWTGW